MALHILLFCLSKRRFTGNQIDGRSVCSSCETCFCSTAQKKRKKEDGPASQPHDDRFTFYNTDTHKMRAIRNPTPNYLVHVLLLIEYRETSDSSCKLACSTGKLTSGKMMHNLLDQILDLVLFCLLFQIMILTILKKYSDWHTCRQMHSFKFSKNNLFFFLFLFVVKFIMNV